jgi:uncharacterized membrane protein
MKYGRYAWSNIFLRLGLGFVFLWIGVDMFRHPEAWIGYLPAQLPLNFDRDTALKLNGIFDVAIGVLVVVNKFPKITAILAVGHLVGILATQGINAVIIRDVGLLGAAMALLLWPSSGYRKARWWKFWRRPSTSTYEE